MGRPSDCPARKYFQYDPKKDVSTCTIDRCGKTIKGQHSGNLTRHLQRNHPTESTGVTLEKQARRSDGGHEDDGMSSNEEKETSTASSSGEFATPTSKPRKKSAGKSKKALVKIDAKVIKGALVELVTTNCRPINIVHDTGMRMLLDPLEESLNVKLNRQNLTEEIMKEATELRQSIISSLRNRLICLKLDTATRLDRSVLGVNAQYWKNGQLQLVNMACRELSQRHTSVNLSREVKGVLREFELSIDNVYTSTHDNAANTVALTGELNKDDNGEEDDDKEEGLDGVDGEENENGDEEAEEKAEEEEIDEEKRIEDDLGDEDESMESSEKSADERLGEETLELLGASSVRCGAHTLQLALNDALGSREKRAIAKARRLSKYLRKPSVWRLLKCQGKKPILDCATRWLGVFYLLGRLIELKEAIMQVASEIKMKNGQFAKEDKALKITAQDWNSFQQIVDCLQPAKVATLRLQAQQLTIGVGDFLDTWLHCKCDTQNVTSSTLAAKIIKKMEAREKKLFENDVFAAAIYMDSRFNVLLSQKQKDAAKTHLVRLHDKILSLQPSTVSDVASGSSEDPISFLEDEESDPVENLLRSKEADSVLEENNRRNSIGELLRRFFQQPRVPKATNIFHYWESRKKSDPELYQLATVALSVPATQVSVETLFSRLRRVLSVLRSNLGPVLIEQIMFVVANRSYRTLNKAKE